MDWTRPGPIPAPQKAKPKVRRGLVLVEAGDVVEAGDGSWVIRSNSEGGEERKALQSGDKVYVGDHFIIAPKSRMEIALGLNARLLLGENTRLKILGKVEYPKTDEDVEVTRRNIELDSGSARVRVRKNLLTPSPIFVVSGNAQLVITRSDTLVSRQSQNRSSTIMVLSGKTEVRIDPDAVAGIKKPPPQDVSKKEKLVIPDGVIKTVPLPEKMTLEEIYAAFSGIMDFSVDREARKRPPPPQENVDLEGP